MPVAFSRPTAGRKRARKNSVGWKDSPSTLRVHGEALAQLHVGLRVASARQLRVQDRPDGDVIGHLISRTRMSKGVPKGSSWSAPPCGEMKDEYSVKMPPFAVSGRLRMT
jgi:hypothetical protein